MKAFVLASLFLLFSISSLAADIETYFEALRNSAVNYEPDGAVCEQVARLKFQEVYPEEQFELMIGVEYSTGGLTIGELDVLIVDRSTQKVVLVAEVKCWKNLKQALEKVQSQRRRFLFNLEKYPRNLRFETYSSQSLKVGQFSPETVFKSLAQAGAVEKGFDMELDLSLSELTGLRMKLLKCQAWGECARAAQ